MSENSIHDVQCPVCHGEDYLVSDQKTGLLRCNYCRNTWIDEHFIKLTDTERYLIEQAKQPRVVVDNTTETDQQLMKMLTGFANVPAMLAQGAQRTFRGCLTLLIVVAILIIAGIAASIFLR
jgi:ribosomal protein L37AE/L43A